MERQDTSFWYEVQYNKETLAMQIRFGKEKNREAHRGLNEISV